MEVMNRKTDIWQWWWSFFAFTNFWKEACEQRCWSLAKISKILAGADILLMPIFVMFLHGGPVQMSRYSAGESPPIKAGRPAATPHLVTARGEDNIFKSENISEVWEKPATADFAEPKQ
jgi:hypothetical protein